MGKPIPEIRARLYELAVIHSIPELADLADDTKRNPPIRRAKSTRRKLTPPVAVKVRAYAKAHPNMAMRDIGLVFNLDQGRISEALNYSKGF